MSKRKSNNDSTLVSSSKKSEKNIEKAKVNILLMLGFEPWTHWVTISGRFKSISKVDGVDDQSWQRWYNSVDLILQYHCFIWKFLHFSMDLWSWSNYLLNEILFTSCRPTGYGDNTIRIYSYLSKNNLLYRDNKNISFYFTLSKNSISRVFANFFLVKSKLSTAKKS